MRAQAFVSDAFLALLLSLVFVSAFSVSPETHSYGKRVRLARACYDLVNEFHEDGQLYESFSNQSLGAQPFPNASLSLLRDRMAHYAQLLDLSQVAFQVDGYQKEQVKRSSVPPETTEECCFPLVDDEGMARMACYEVGA